MSFSDGSAVFLLSVTGQVATGRFQGGADDLYCKICFVAGPDWAVTAGQEEGISQIARKGCPSSGSPLVIWNFPLDVTFRSTCPHGWPQVVVSVYELDSFGNESVRGYGSSHVPLSPGSHSSKIPIFRPESSSLVQRMASYVTGRRPEFVDPRVAASGEGRDVTRVRTNGWVKVTFSVISKDLKRLGYEVTPRPRTAAAGGGGGGGGREMRNRGPGEGIGLVSKDRGRRDPSSQPGGRAIEDLIEEEEEGEEVVAVEEGEGGGHQVVEA